jgi:hypothetical protein
MVECLTSMCEALSSNPSTKKKKKKKEQKTPPLSFGSLSSLLALYPSPSLLSAPPPSTYHTVHSEAPGHEWSRVSAVPHTDLSSSTRAGCLCF